LGEGHVFFWVVLGLAALFLVGAIALRGPWARLFAVALAFPVALLTYGILGIGIARTIGVGRFYSVPVGAERIEDWHILVSLAFWTCVWVSVILWRLGRWRGAS
jgi:hypothetical protein